MPDKDISKIRNQFGNYSNHTDNYSNKQYKQLKTIISDLESSLFSLTKWGDLGYKHQFELKLKDVYSTLEEVEKLAQTRESAISRNEGEIKLKLVNVLKSHGLVESDSLSANQLLFMLEDFITTTMSDLKEQHRLLKSKDSKIHSMEVKVKQ